MMVREEGQVDVGKTNLAVSILLPVQQVPDSTMIQ